MELKTFWEGKKVFVTGHTGFKGSWLCLELIRRGAVVKGFSLTPHTNPNLWSLLSLKEMESRVGDVRDTEKLQKEIVDFNPEIIIHAAAQAIVLEGYQNPLETFSTNIMGTANVLEAARASSRVKVILNVTTDKVYENENTQKSFSETDPLGASDPYSTSKAASELVTASYRKSFFSNIKVATARAGNVIGGGDWSENRLVPDIIRAVENNSELVIRRPQAVRPWQHVIDVNEGYLKYIEYLYSSDANYVSGLNFAPTSNKPWSVEEILQFVQRKFPELHLKYQVVPDKREEADFLSLDSSLALKTIGWKNKWDIAATIEKSFYWYSECRKGVDSRELSVRQLREHLSC
ncbi:MAG: CDP-glucose 4,6-dehydratase [Bacteriovoracaceae bacterium]